MYEDYYGLSGRPFALTPDAKFWFDTVTHKKAMSYLGYGLSQGEGFIVITGEVGAGKTTLVGHLMARVDPSRLHVVKLSSTQIGSDDLLRIVAHGLEAGDPGATKAHLLAAIERGLHAVARSGRRTLLIVDEAQALPIGALEELRMLSNFQAGGHPLLQIFLLGQPEFRERMHGSERLEQLRQRVIAVHHLDPMGPEEVEPYMAHRLSLTGWTGRPRFTVDAFEALYRGSGGIPRQLNQLASRVLLHGSVEKLDTIDGAAVDAVIADVARDMMTPRPVPAPLPSPAIQPEPEGAPLPVLNVVEPEPEPEPVAVDEVAAPVIEAPLFVAPLPFVADAPAFAPVPTPEPEPEPIVAAAPEPVAEHITDAVGKTEAEADPTLDDRMAGLEARLEDQDATLRRILTLLVDWVETDRRPGTDGLRGTAA